MRCVYALADSPLADWLMCVLFSTLTFGLTSFLTAIEGVRSMLLDVLDWLTMMLSM